MDKQKFVQFLRDPASMDAASAKELNQIIKQYPYFQSARTLMAKVSKMHNLKNAPAYISAAALYATDRSLLKKYINDQLIFLSPMEVHESHEADHERDLGKAIKSQRLTVTKKVSTTKDQAPSKKLEVPNVDKQETQTDKQATPQEKPKPQALAPSTPRRPTEKKADRPVNERPKAETPSPPPTPKAKIVPTTPSESSSLDSLIKELYADLEQLKVNRAKLKQIEEHIEEEEAVDKAVRLATSHKETPEPSPETDTPSKGEEDPAINDTLSNDTLEEQAPSITSEEIEATSNPAEQPAEEPMFIDLDEKDPSVEEGDIALASEPFESEEVIPDEEIGTETEPGTTPNEIVSDPVTTNQDVHPIPPEQQMAGGGSTKELTEETDKVTHTESLEPFDSEEKMEMDDGHVDEKQEDIINNFIKLNPSITPGQASTFSLESGFSLDHLDLHPDVASEYLAEIFLEQGRKDRAIQIYQTLIERIPEKSAYFANIIKTLKES